MEDPSVWKAIVAERAKTVVAEEGKLVAEGAQGSSSAPGDSSFYKSMMVPLLEIKFKGLFTNASRSLTVGVDDVAEVKKGREMFVSEALKCLKLVHIDLVVPSATVLDAVEGAEVVVKMPNKGREVTSLDEWLLECVGYKSNMGVKVKRLMEARSLDRARAFEVYMRESTDSELMAQTYARLRPLPVAARGRQDQKSGMGKAARRSDGAGLTPGVCKYTSSNCPFNPCKYRLHSEEVSQVGRLWTLSTGEAG
ncbi:hypothetical protein FOL47_005510 [Perkinsus chesapeaki]|uniref:Uncharacterized protein n=1 Tax=Perkinsus chesapeaki TaxID=330153 RepID=A0A7J6LX69_PERCH|nr:hypothetical protein FOL47_005510 [Perkinsus chesapeaki]